MFESQASQGGHIRHSTFRARFILCEIRDLDWFVKTRVGIPTFNSESFELELNLGYLVAPQRRSSFVPNPLVPPRTGDRGRGSTTCIAKNREFS